jgi:hypothetical protein
MLALVNVITAENTWISYLELMPCFLMADGMFQRLFMISYLDEEILIIRDASGAPDVLTRLEGPQPNSIDGTSDAVLSEYES